MTRETKIGLLVGLCFIIVIGILLSEAFHTDELPPAANLAIAGTTVHLGDNSPGSSRPAISFFQPQVVQPRQTLPLHEDLVPPHSPVRLTTPQPGGQQPAPSNPGAAASTDVGGVLPSTGSQDTSLFQLAHKTGQDLVQLGPDGKPITPDPGVISTYTPQPPAPGERTQPGPTPPAPTPVATAGRSYVAQPGDSVSKMAAHFLGSSTKTTRNLIIQANPTLQANPDRVVVGQTYVIPVAPAAGQTTQPPATPTVPPAAPPVAARTPPPAAPIAAPDTHYTVLAGDTLWKIARDQLGDPHMVDAIKDLNADVLRGDDHDVVTPGMKLTLPARTVASAH